MRTDMAEQYIQFNAIYIDAWRDADGGWSWNDMSQMEAGIVFRADRLTPRLIARKFREWGWLSKESAGKIRVDMSCDECIEIQDKNTGRPIYALSQLHGDPIPESMR